MHTRVHHRGTPQGCITGVYHRSVQGCITGVYRSVSPTQGYHRDHHQGCITGVPQECTGVYHGGVSQGCATRVGHPGLRTWRLEPEWPWSLRFGACHRGVSQGGVTGGCHYCYLLISLCSSSASEAQPWYVCCTEFEVFLGCLKNHRGCTQPAKERDSHARTAAARLAESAPATQTGRPKPHSGRPRPLCSGTIKNLI